MNRMKDKWYGITYPRFLGHRPIWWLWLKFLCPRGVHLWDECCSVEEHYLSCDACGLLVHMEKIDETYWELKQPPEEAKNETKGK